MEKNDSEDKKVYDFICIGSGAAGLAAAIYAGRYRMKTAVFGNSFGGYTSIAGDIENYPGYVSIDGFDLMMVMKQQAEKVGATIIDEKITSVVQEEDGCFIVTSEKGVEYHARTVMIATGMEHKTLGLKNEKELTSKGVHYCVTCDGPLYGGKVIGIVGGGDAAVKGANLVAEYAKKIYIFVRSNTIKAEPINYEQLQKLGDKVEILFETQIQEIIGTTKFEKVILSKPYNGSTELSFDGLFIEIGHLPRTDLAKSLGLQLDEKGFIKTDSFMRTNKPGIFAAGDVIDLFGSFKQDITSTAMGAVAATTAYEYCKTNSNVCKLETRNP